MGGTDNKERCFYYEVKLVVTRGNDPDKKVGPHCEPGGSQEDWDAFRKERRLPAAGGQSIEHAEVKFCEVKSGPDECETEVVDLPDHRREGAPAQFHRAINLMEMSLSRFLSAKEAHESPFDWSDDGCSAPNAKWNRRFRTACQRHDFGYRNFGPGRNNDKWLDADDARREYVDENFSRDMRHICGEHDWNFCGKVANTYFQGVRKCGPTAFWQEGTEACVPD